MDESQIELSEVNCLRSNKTSRRHVYIFSSNFDKTG